MNKGEKNGRAKLTTEDVIVLKEMINEGIRHRTIADTFDLSLIQVRLIASGKRWIGVGPEMIPRKYERSIKDGSNTANGSQSSSVARRKPEGT